MGHQQLINFMLQYRGEKYPVKESLHQLRLEVVHGIAGLRGSLPTEVPATDNGYT